MKFKIVFFFGGVCVIITNFLCTKYESSNYLQEGVLKRVFFAPNQNCKRVEKMIEVCQFFK